MNAASGRLGPLAADRSLADPVGRKATPVGVFLLPPAYAGLPSIGCSIQIVVPLISFRFPRN